MMDNRVPDWIKGVGTILFAFIFFWCWFLGMFSPMEGKVAFDPYIDTWFAPNFNPDHASMIKIGQTKDEVEAILGQPLFVHPPGHMCEGAIRYDYTQDGGYNRRLNIDVGDRGHKDFAWHRFSVCFDRTGVVSGIDNGWSYD